MGVLFFFGIALYFGLNMAQAATGDITQTGCIGKCETAVLDPQGVDIDSQGNIWVADGSYNRVIKFSSSGEVLKVIAGSTLNSNGYPESSSYSGEFNTPVGIAIDNSDNVYVLDKGNYRVQKFSINGVYQGQFGSYGSSAGQLSNNATGITTDNSGNIYVADSYNYRVQKYDTQGVSAGTFENGGTGAFSPIDVAVNSYGTVFVIDSTDGDIDTFNSSGTLTSSTANDFAGASAIAVDSSGNMYLAQGSTVKRYDGNFLSVFTEYGSYGSNAGQIVSVTGLASDANNNIYIAENHIGDPPKIEKFNNSGTHQVTIGQNNNAFNLVRSGVIYDSYGNLYVSDSGNSIVRKYDSSRAETLRIGTYGSYGGSDGQFNKPFGVDIDSSGNIYVADSDNNRIQKVSSDGSYATSFYGSDTPSSGLVDVGDVKIDSQGNIYALSDTGGEHFVVYKLDSSGAYVATIGSNGSNADQYSFPASIDIDSQNNIYVADAGNGHIKMYSNTGTFIEDIGTSGDCGGDGAGGVDDDNGELCFPYGVAIDENDNVYVAEYGNTRIQKFNSEHNFELSWSMKDSDYVSSSEAPIMLAVHDGEIAVVTSDDSIIFLDEELVPVQSTTTTTASTTTTTTDSTTTTTTLAPSTTTPGSDGDNDGVSDSIESGGPNSGDANSDGTPDVQQSNVTTLINSSTNKYITLVAPGGVTITQSSLATEASLAQQDSTYSYPGGVLSFSATTTPGSTIDISVLYHDISESATKLARKIHASGSNVTYTTITGATFSSSTLEGKNVLTMTYSITDGGTLDEDTNANGTIIDPVGLAVASSSAGGTAAGTSLPTTGSNTASLVYLSAMLLVIGLFCVWFALRMKRLMFAKTQI